ncbi:hypothetical protein EBI_23414 [Enterocytozoon bieneusi H348]|nr:hypothetical protein EBI_25431 [Enterocytozoon bieneusi H348]EED43269.1 hypothetical protein EBI_26510 [Enterocytozoon bieneusi H348]EED43546.1 hypothetical protein EBI_23414 [Enterocytozoon bieneusi H348]|eukprot:XP_002650508.1 hypothetical protein EBI_23414 [Enterocytozoon bieneusi H348]
MQKKSLEWMSHDVEDLESYIKTGHEEISRVIELVLNNEDTSDAHHRKYVPELTLEEIYDVFENVADTINTYFDYNKINLQKMKSKIKKNVAFKKILNKKTMLEFDKCTNPGDGNTRVYSKLINFVNPETNYE